MSPCLLILLTAHPFASGNNFICDKAKDQMDESFCQFSDKNLSKRLLISIISCLSKMPRKSLTNTALLACSPTGAAGDSVGFYYFLT